MLKDIVQPTKSAQSILYVNLNDYIIFKCNEYDKTYEEIIEIIFDMIDHNGLSEFIHYPDLFDFIDHISKNNIMLELQKILDSSTYEYLKLRFE